MKELQNQPRAVIQLAAILLEVTLDIEEIKTDFKREKKNKNVLRSWFPTKSIKDRR